MKARKTENAIRVTFYYMVVDLRQINPHTGHVKSLLIEHEFREFDELYYQCQMCVSYFETIYEELIDFGLEINKEFIIEIEGNIYGVGGKAPKKHVEFKVDWLCGENTNKGLYLFRNNNPQKESK